MQQSQARDATGRQAASPWAMGWPAWKAVLLRSYKEASADNIGLVAAGVAFYGFLALVPLLAATVLTYGLIADPQAVVEDMQGMMTVMPADAAKLIGEQLMNVVQTSSGKKGFGVLVALAVALFGARNGASALITALNIAYEEEERRSFIRLNLLALGITASAVLLAIVALVAVAALGHLDTLFPGAPGFLLVAGKLLSYLLLAGGGAAGAATLYRYGPSRERARWVWLSPGSLFAAVGWLLLTVGFGLYVASFGNYNATYGSLGAVVVLLTWFYLSSYVLLLGAEINSEFEHQTAQDTTRGPAAPIGTRGAWVADHVAGAPAESGPQPAHAPARPAARPAAATPAKALGVVQAGLLTSLLASGGLALLRRRGGEGVGAALLAAAGGLALWRRPPPPDQSPTR